MLLTPRAAAYNQCGLQSWNYCNSQNFTEFTESQGWKRPSRSLSPTHALTPQLDHGTKCHIQYFFKYSQGWWLYHLPRQTIAVLYHSFCRKLFPNIQPIFPLVQFKAVSSGSVSAAWRKSPTPAEHSHLSGSCREWWGHPWVSFSPGWTTPAPSALPHRVCVPDPSQGLCSRPLSSLVASFASPGHTRVSMSSLNWGDRTGHRSRGGSIPSCNCNSTAQLSNI